MNNSKLNYRPRILPNGQPMEHKKAEELLNEWEKLRQADKNNTFFASILRKLHLNK